jgi:hypothetical protein
MTRFILATSLLVGCTQNADIGISGQPVSCMPNSAAAAAAHGSLHDATANTTYTFAATSPRLSFMPITVTLSSNTGTADAPVFARLAFLCGQPTVDTYGVEPVQPQRIDCPLSVAGSAGMANFFADSSTGTLIVDENVNCLAGRFDVTFGDKGAVAGWFSVPWQ